MENRTNQEELGQKQPNNFKRSIWWKIYFFILTFLSVIGTLSILPAPKAGIAEYISLLLLIIATTGLYGFVFVKPIYKQQFWFKLFITYVLYTITYNFITDVDLRMGMNDMEYYITTAIGFLISLPAYIGLYAYSKSNNIAWKNA